MSRSETKPDPIDVRFGKLLRMARTTRHMSQETLGGMNGLTFQQIQKYERGTNRVSISRLVHLANSLDVPAAWFIEKLDNGKQPSPEFDFAVLNQGEAQDLLRFYARITDKDHRNFLRHITKLLAANDGAQNNEGSKARGVQ